ncbi:MAG TPA: DUF2127 domain-containing protein [Candidatus Binatia bacterium]|nr:DUF2127 domain-containing protein [Candidatus Binatia bacterium]
MDKREQSVKSRPDNVDKAFKVSLYLKGLDGLLEIFGGILLLLITPDQINHLARWLTEGELSEDPHDFIANHVLKTAHSLTGASLAFGAAYLLSHGIVKVVLVIEVLRNHLWAYLALIAVTGLFVIYQIYRLLVDGFSASLFLLTIFDIVIIYLTQKEYRRHKARHDFATDKV